MAHRVKTYTWQVLLLLLILGGIIGSWLGELIAKIWPASGIFGETYSIGLSPVTLNLQVCKITFGFMLDISFFTIIGFLLAYIVFKKL